MQIPPIVRRRCAFNRAIAFAVRAPVEPLERRELLNGSPPRILDARTAFGDAPYTASILAQFDDADITAGDTRPRSTLVTCPGRRPWRCKTLVHPFCSPSTHTRDQATGAPR